MIAQISASFKKTTRNKTISLQGAITEEILTCEILEKEMHKISNVKVVTQIADPRPWPKTDSKSPNSELSDSIL